jgi:hypothetical protein
MNVTVQEIPATRDITIVLSEKEAMMLRRMCYYNLTVRDKFTANPCGGQDKAQALYNFMCELGDTLKAHGIERY